MSRRLAIVVAHPDDDTFAIAGTAAIHGADAGFELTVVLVTSGDAGQIADPSLANAENLGQVREAEDRASWQTLGIEPRGHHFLRYRDEHVAEADRGELVERIAQTLREARPDVVVTFGPEGITGHADHIAVGEATTEAFHRLRAEGGEGLHRLLYSSVPEGRIRWFSDRLVERGMDPIDSSQPYQPRGVPDGSIAVEVDCSSVWQRVWAALREHRTQNDAEAFPEDLAEAILSTEHFTQGWPERAPGAPVLRDVFEGVPTS